MNGRRNGAAEHAGSEAVGLEQGAELLESLEREYPVADWTAAGIRIWPLVRVRLGYAITFRAMHKKVPRLGRVEWASRALLSAAAVARAGWSALGEHAAHREEPRPGGSVAGVFLSDGISFVKDGGSWFDRNCDPLREIASDAGLSTILLIPGTEARSPARPPVRHVQPSFDVARLRGALRPARDVRLPGYERVRAALDSYALAEDLPTPSVIGQAARAVDLGASACCRWLERWQPRVGFVVEYYALQSMAFVLACRRFGIPSVDIQHGVEGALHFAYGRWSRVPTAGYELLPDFFWVWSDHEAEAINQWSETVETHRPVVGGNLYSRRWSTRSAVDPVAQQLDQRATGTDVQVLVSLSVGETDDELAFVYEIISACPVEWLWWLRCHPLDPDSARWTEGRDARGLANVEVDLATSAPLPVLLAKTDVHVTRFSTVVIDAAQLGVPSIVTDAVGEELFPVEFRSGLATYAAPSADALRQAIESTTAARKAGLGSFPLGDDATIDRSDGVEWAIGLLRGAA